MFSGELKRRGNFILRMRTMMARATAPLRELISGWGEGRGNFPLPLPHPLIIRAFAHGGWLARLPTVVVVKEGNFVGWQKLSCSIMSFFMQPQNYAGIILYKSPTLDAVALIAVRLN